MQDFRPFARCRLKAGGLGYPGTPAADSRLPDCRSDRGPNNGEQSATSASNWLKLRTAIFPTIPNARSARPQAAPLGHARRCFVFCAFQQQWINKLARFWLLRVVCDCRLLDCLGFARCRIAVLLLAGNMPALRMLHFTESPIVDNGIIVSQMRSWLSDFSGRLVYAG